MEPKQRASRGNTHEPYDCCKKPPDSRWGRPKGSICRECTALIADGRAANERAQSQQAAGGQGVYQWTTQDYGWPRYYGIEARFDNSVSGNAAHERLARALYDLVNLASEPAPATTDRLSPKLGEPYRDTWGHGIKAKKTKRDQLPWPFFLSVKTDRSDAWTWHALVVASPALREAIDELDKAIRHALERVYAQGKQDGRNLLLGLASGEVSIVDFEMAERTQRERAEDERARDRKYEKARRERLASD